MLHLVVLTDYRLCIDEAPLAVLFKSPVTAWKSEAIVKDEVLGLKNIAVNGTTFRCQDSEDDAQTFGFLSQKHNPYPQLCSAGLMATEECYAPLRLRESVC